MFNKDMPKYKTANPRKIISAHGLGETLDKMRENWVKSLTVLLWAYGVRIGEALALTYEDFTISEGYLWVRSTPLKNSNDPHRILPLPINTPHFYILINYLRNGDKTPNKRVWKYSHQWYSVKLKEADQELSPHVFRHNRGTKMAQFKDMQGVRTDPYELMSWLGHSDLRSALKYIHGAGVFAEDLGKKVQIS